MYLTPSPTIPTGKVKNSIGGYPKLPEGVNWPVCPQTNKEMVFFLQIDLSEFFQEYSDYHLSIFMSPEVNEISSFEPFPEGIKIEDSFWNSYEQHFKIYCFQGGYYHSKCDEYLKYKELLVSESTEEQKIQIGNKPLWVQDPEWPISLKGNKFDFLLQIPDSFAFEKKEKAPEQPDSFSHNDYCLFLGNQIYLFFSKEYNHNEAVWVTLQN